MDSEVPNGPVAIGVDNICDGAVVEAFNVSLLKVLHNIYDLNTPATMKRRIDLTVEFKPKDDRVQIDVTFQCNTKLAAISPSTSRVFAARDEDGNLYALSSDPRQMNIFQPPKIQQVLPPVIEFSAAK